MAAPGPGTVALRLPTKYASPSSPTITSPSAAAPPPPPEWLHGTWTVTDSTLSMWRTARNVRISYAPLPLKDGGASASPRNRDLVEYEAASGKGGVKTVSGTNTASGATYEGAWDWRGNGWLFFVTSHWEVLGWGERPLPAAGGGAEEAGGEAAVERWAVTWFAKTLFTKEGVDVYSDRKEGISDGLRAEIMAALKGLPARQLADMCERDMRSVEISLPWKER